MFYYVIMKYIKGGDSGPEKINLNEEIAKDDNALTRNDENDNGNLNMQTFDNDMDNYDESTRNLMQEEDIISIGNMSPEEENDDLDYIIDNTLDEVKNDEMEIQGGKTRKNKKTKKSKKSRKTKKTKKSKKMKKTKKTKTSKKSKKSKK